MQKKKTHLWVSRQIERTNTSNIIIKLNTKISIPDFQEKHLKNCKIFFSICGVFFHFVWFRKELRMKKMKRKKKKRKQ